MKKIYETEYGRFSLEEHTKFSSQFERGDYNQRENIALMRSLVSSEDTVVDVGAHIGSVAIPLAKVAREVIAFEPTKQNFDDLVANIELNQLQNIQAFPYGVGEKEGMGSTTAENPGNTGTYFVTEGSDFRIVTLDSVVGSAQLIKIDVQGMEPQVLRGAYRLVSGSRPHIFIEISPWDLYKFAYDPIHEIQTFFEEHDYKMYVQTPKGLCRVHSLALACLAFQPRAYLFRKPGGPFDILASGSKQKTEIRFPRTYLWSLFLKKLWFTI